MAERKNNVIKLLAYFLVPAFFACLCYVLLYVGFRPVIDLVSAGASLLMSDSVPNFNPELTDIYDPNAKKAADEIVQPSETPEPGATPDPVTPKIPISAITFPKLGQRYGNLTCDRIGLDSPVYWGDSNDVLRNGAGQYWGSFLPGFGRVILISAHNTTYFKCLQNIQVDDIITFDTNYDTYKYVIFSVEVMEETELDRLMEKQYFLDENETLILYTCYPFHAISGRKHKRLVAFGIRLEGMDVQWRSY